MVLGQLDGSAQIFAFYTGPWPLVTTFTGFDGKNTSTSESINNRITSWSSNFQLLGACQTDDSSETCDLVCWLFSYLLIVDEVSRNSGRLWPLRQLPNVSEKGVSPNCLYKWVLRRPLLHKIKTFVAFFSSRFFKLHAPIILCLITTLLNHLSPHPLPHRWTTFIERVYFTYQDHNLTTYLTKLGRWIKITKNSYCKTKWLLYSKMLFPNSCAHISGFFYYFFWQGREFFRVTGRRGKVQDVGVSSVAGAITPQEQRWTP